jgi:hypothetical protein
MCGGVTKPEAIDHIGAKPYKFVVRAEQKSPAVRGFLLC